MTTVFAKTKCVSFIYRPSHYFFYHYLLQMLVICYNGPQAVTLLFNKVGWAELVAPLSASGLDQASACWMFI